MQQFREEEVFIDIPNATVIFPKKFDEQIARVCLIINNNVIDKKGE